MATDVAALQAQSQAGQAGLAAYQQAQTEIERRRKQAVEQAMQEAALRGATGTSVTAAAEGIGAGADERLMSLGSDRALYEADMARRGERMNQYAEGVQSARGLLGQQVDLVTAPIKAQSAADVAKIEAQARAELARMQAALAGRGGGGGGGGGGRGGGGGGKGGGSKKVNQTEASKLLATRAQTNIQSKLTPVKAAQAQNVKAQPAIQQAEFARQAGSYAGRAAQEYAAKHPAPPPIAPIAQTVGMKNQAANYAGRAAQEWARTHGGATGNAAEVIRGAQQQAMNAVRGGAAQVRYRAEVGKQPYYDPGKRINELIGGGFRGMTNTEFDQAGNMIPAKLIRQRPIGDVQKQAFDVLGEEVDLGEGIGKVKTRDLGKVNLGGSIYDLSRSDTNQAEIERLQSDPETWRNALLDAYQQLTDEGYQIDDAMFLAATEPSTANVGTYGDWINQRENAPSDSEIRAQQNALEADIKNARTDEERAIAEDELAALEESRSAFATKTGGWDLKSLAGGGLSEKTVIDITNKPNFPALLADAQNAWDTGTSDEFENFLRENQVTPMERILIKKMVV